MKNGKTLGILGGLGPMASAYFYELVTAHTKAETDQDHIDILLSSRASTPDRSAFILGRSAESPLPALVKAAQLLECGGAEVLALPCNTAHFFYTDIQQGVSVPLLNMVEQSVARAQQCASKTLGILATSGTLQCGVYQRACKNKGLACIQPNEEDQAALMQIIYSDIKAGRPANMPAFTAIANALFAQGCDTLLLGCTELSLLKRQGGLDNRFLSSMDVLAHASITACGKTPVGFEW